jgi:hypothetical protein
MIAPAGAAADPAADAVEKAADAANARVAADSATSSSTTLRDDPAKPARTREPAFLVSSSSVVLGLVLSKYISYAFQELHDRLAADKDSDPEGICA